MNNADLVKLLRALARCEHSDFSLGDEAADAIRELETAFKSAVEGRQRVQEQLAATEVVARRYRDGWCRLNEPKTVTGWLWWKGGRCSAPTDAEKVVIDKLNKETE